MIKLNRYLKDNPSIFDKICFKIDDLISWFSSKYQILERMVFWGWKLRYDYDFDAHVLYHHHYLKLDRMYKCFRDHGHCAWNSDINNPRMRHLRITRELAKRLYEDGYRTHIEAHNKKWGLPNIRFIEIPKSRYFTSTIDRENVKTEKDKKLERDSFKRAISKDHAQKKQEKRMFFDLMEKNIDIFWD